MKRLINTVRAACAAFTVVSLSHSAVVAQGGLNNLWMGGYVYAGIDTILGGIDLNYITGNRVISTVNRDIDFFRTSANITNASGELLFSTNGVHVANATGDTMLNGAGLNPSWYTTELSGPPGGLLLTQSDLILPKPEAPNMYYLFHGTYDDPPWVLARYLYLTTIDMSLEGGMGAVVNKNQVLLEDSLQLGKITAVRHANGRDWWVFCHKANSNLFYRFLVTPSGVALDGTQAIGTVRVPDVGQVCFSPDGTRFAYYSAVEGDLDLYAFDRCTGLLSDPRHAQEIGVCSSAGVAFSPNSQLLYVSSCLNLYQFDTEAEDLAASMVTIAHWDSTYSPSPPFAALFDLAQLAPDGKVYISTGNGTMVLHVVNDPDSAGMACNFEQHGVALPRVFSNSLPNHPNYHLGPVDGSVCDSLGLNAGLNAALSGAEGYLRAAPNPTHGQFILSYPANPQVGWLEVRNPAGQLVLRERIPQWSTMHAVELQGQPAGMYQCNLRWGMQAVGTRIILLEQ